MKRFSWFSFCLVALCIGGSGCARHYDALPDIPTYDTVEESFDTSADLAICEIPGGDSLDVQLHALLKKKLIQNGYRLIPEADRFSSTPRSPDWLLMPISVDRRYSSQPDGYYVDWRIIVSVRRPGVLYHNYLQYGTFKTFQAWVRVSPKDAADLNNGTDKGVAALQEWAISHALDNLFRIPEFRHSLEPAWKAKHRIEWLKKSARQGDHHAQIELATIYLSGNEAIAPNQGEALRWLKRCAEAENEQALQSLARILDQEYNDPSFHMQWVPFLAQKNVPLAQYLQAKDFEKGTFNTPVNTAEAKKLYKAASDGAYLPAKMKYGQLLIAEGSVQQGFSCVEEAAKQGCAPAMFFVGQCYEHGKYVEQNLALAQQWYQRGKSCGDSNCISAISRLKKKQKK